MRLQTNNRWPAIARYLHTRSLWLSQRAPAEKVKQTDPSINTNDPAPPCPCSGLSASFWVQRSRHPSSPVPRHPSSHPAPSQAPVLVVSVPACLYKWLDQEEGTCRPHPPVRSFPHFITLRSFLPTFLSPCLTSTFGGSHTFLPLPCRFTLARAFTSRGRSPVLPSQAVPVPPIPSHHCRCRCR